MLRLTTAGDPPYSYATWCVSTSRNDAAATTAGDSAPWLHLQRCMRSGGQGGASTMLQLSAADELA